MVTTVSPNAADDVKTASPVRLTISGYPAR
jgi:hypothetical protein